MVSPQMTVTICLESGCKIAVSLITIKVRVWETHYQSYLLNEGQNSMIPGQGRDLQTEFQGNFKKALGN